MIILRPATMDDRDILMQWRNDMDCERWFQTGDGEVTAKEHELWLARWIIEMHVKEMKSDRMRTGLFMAEVSTLGARTIVGVGRVTDNFQSRVPSACLIHFTVAPAARRCGLGTELVRELVRKAKEDMGYATVGAKIHRANEASLKCALMGGVTAVEFL